MRAIKNFHLDVDLRQKCVLSFFFEIYMKWFDTPSQTNEYLTIRRGKNTRLSFEEDSIYYFFKSDLQLH